MRRSFSPALMSFSRAWVSAASSSFWACLLQFEKAFSDSASFAMPVR